jgi:hypothetical protein
VGVPGPERVGPGGGVPQDVVRPARRWAPQAGRHRAEQHDGRRAERRREMGDARVAHHQTAGVREQRAQRGERHAPRSTQDRRGGQARAGGHRPRQRLLSRPRRHHHGVARAPRGPGHGGEPLRRPAPGRGVRAGVDHHGPRRGGRAAGNRDARLLGLGRQAVPAQEPAPAVPLVLVRPPRRAVDRGELRMAERPERARPQPFEEPVTERPTAVQVDRQAGRRPCPRQRGRDRSPRRARRQQPVHCARGPYDLLQRPRRGQHDLVARKPPTQRPQSGHGGQHVTQPEGPQHEHRGPPASGAVRHGGGVRGAGAVRHGRVLNGGVPHARVLPGTSAVRHGRAPLAAGAPLRSRPRIARPGGRHRAPRRHRVAGGRPAAARAARWARDVVERPSR